MYKITEEIRSHTAYDRFGGVVDMGGWLHCRQDF